MIDLESILHIDNDKDYKVHFAVYNYKEEPLDVFVRDKSEWQGWSEWRNGRNDFNRRYIFSLIRFYPQKNRWLFGGIYEVLKRQSDGYRLRLVNEHSCFIIRSLFVVP